MSILIYSLNHLVRVEIAFIIDSCMLILPSCALIYFWHKTPAINDHFYIRYEMRIIAWITIIGLLSYVVLMIFITIIDPVHFYGSLSLIGSVQYMAYNMTSLYFIPNKLQKNYILGQQFLCKNKKNVNDLKTPDNPSKRHDRRSRVRTASDLNEVVTVIELNDAHKRKMQNSLSPNAPNAPNGNIIDRINSNTESMNDVIGGYSYPSVNSVHSAFSNSLPETPIDGSEVNMEEKHNKDEIVIVTDNELENEHENVVENEKTVSQNTQIGEEKETVIIYEDANSKKSINFSALLQQILSHTKSYEAFLIHLSKEYSMYASL